MSTYPYWFLSFRMRNDAEVEREALTEVAAGRTPHDGLLERLHPVVRFYLADATRFLDGELGPRAGTPVRLWRTGSDRGPHTGLSIELCFHDDHFADAGWLFWIWVLSLVSPPDLPRREVIGFEGSYRQDPDMTLVHVTPDGISNHAGDLGWHEIAAQLQDWSAYEGYGW